MSQFLPDTNVFSKIFGNNLLVKQIVESLDAVIDTTVYIEIRLIVCVMVPDIIFTPNNDGKNDCYGIKYWGTILDLQFTVTDVCKIAAAAYVKPRLL